MIGLQLHVSKEGWLLMKHHDFICVNLTATVFVVYEGVVIQSLEEKWKMREGFLVRCYKEYAV